MRTAFLSVLACALVFASCQKDTSATVDTPGTVNRVKTYTETITSSVLGNSSTTYNVSYDNNGRMSNVVSATSSGDKFVYTYPAANKYTMELFNSGTLSIHEDFFLNTDGLPDSTMQYNDTRDTATEKYTYNQSKQLATLKEYDYTKATGAVLDNITTYTYDANGNLSKTQDAYGQIHAYEYYTDLTYVVPMLPGPVNVYISKKVNPVKKHTLFYNSTLVGSAQMTYTFDDKNRVNTEKAVASDGSTVLKTYTYY